MTTDNVALHLAPSRRRHPVDFSNWRILRTAERPTGNRCVKCDCRLSSGNRTDTCCSCSIGEIELPEWALAILDADPSPHTLATLADLIGGQARPSKYNLKTAATHAAIGADYAKGLSQYYLASKYGMSRSGVQKVLLREGGAEK